MEPPIGRFRGNRQNPCGLRPLLVSPATMSSLARFHIATPYFCVFNGEVFARNFRFGISVSM